MHPLSIAPIAWREMHRAFAWYRERDEAVALRFLDAFWQAIDEVAEAPERWPTTGTRHRYRMLKKPFPYFIAYRRDWEQIRVVALSHTKRRPGYWKRRK